MYSKFMGILYMWHERGSFGSSPVTSADEHVWQASPEPGARALDSLSI